MQISEEKGTDLLEISERRENCIDVREIYDANNVYAVKLWRMRARAGGKLVGQRKRERKEPREREGDPPPI